MRRYRNTKIVATLGPSTRTKRQIRALIMAGVDVFRLNFSHGEHSDKKSRVIAIRELEKELDRPVSIMADLQGPKLRIGEFKDGEIELAPGDNFSLDLKEKLGPKAVFSFRIRKFLMRRKRAWISFWMMEELGCGCRK